MHVTTISPFRRVVTLFTLLVALAANGSGQSRTSGDSGHATIENAFVAVSFDLRTGCYEIRDKVRNTIPVRNAYFQAEGLRSKDHPEGIEWSQEVVDDDLGKGKSLVVVARYEQYADIVWRATVYDTREFIVLGMGIVNDTRKPYTLTAYYPFRSASVLRGMGVQENFVVLNGNSGGNKTYAKDTTGLLCFNNIMIRCGDLRAPTILVAGGLTYHDFEKFCSFSKAPDSISLQIWSEDPVGKIVAPGTSYISDDRFYFCCHNANPFEAMESYGLAVRRAQHIQLNYYDFPTECLWYATVFAQDPNRRKFNDTRGAVEEMENAIKSGFTRYSRVAIRLVPDAYGPDNQQGWWDDEHWAMWGDNHSADGANYVEPYLTTGSWCAEILKRGGIPMTYFQANRRSEDFVKAHPDYMLFNDPHKLAPEHNTRLRQNTEIGSELEGYFKQWWSEDNLFGYDFTDPGFVRHMKDVYARLKAAGMKGIMYDYPEATGWAYAGGFDDPYSTTANAYRRIFELASTGLDRDAYIDERMLGRGTDIASGLTASQRIWGDNDIFVPEMVARSGMRWYKNRVITNYDLDAKDPLKARPLFMNDGLKTLMTMAYVVSGRFLLARSFYQLSPEQLYVMSRTFPYHAVPKSSRPIDAFNKGVVVPRIFDYEVSDSWHQLTLYNPCIDSTTSAPGKIDVSLGRSLNEGGLGLDGSRTYYLYDFWNDTLTAVIKGSAVLTQQLRPGETRMISIHAQEQNPQFLSTNRHIMQGYVDMSAYPTWNGTTRQLSGVSRVVGGETYKVVIAANGRTLVGAKAAGGKASVHMKDVSRGLLELWIDKEENGPTEWIVSFK